MGATSSCEMICDSEENYRYNAFISSSLKLNGTCSPNEDSINYLKSYGAQNPESVPLICKRLVKSLNRSLKKNTDGSRKKVILIIKVLYALLSDASNVEPFTPHVCEIASILFESHRRSCLLGGADLLALLSQKLVEQNADHNVRRLLRDNKDKLLPGLHQMLCTGSLWTHKRMSWTNSSMLNFGSQSDQESLSETKRHRKSRKLRKLKKFMTFSSSSDDDSDDDRQLAKSSTWRPPPDSAGLDGTVGASQEKLCESWELQQLLGLYPERMAIFAASCTAIGNLLFCAPELLSDFVEWHTLRPVVRHILYSIHLGIHPPPSTQHPPSEPLPSTSSDFLSREMFHPLTEEPEWTCATDCLSYIQKSSIHTLRSFAYACTASFFDKVFICVMNTFEEDGEEGSWGLHEAIDTVFFSLAEMIERQPQKLGMCLVTAIAYTIYLGKSLLPVVSSAPPSPTECPESNGPHTRSSPSDLLPNTHTTVLPVVAAATAAASAARPVVRPESIRKAFASPAAFGGLLRALYQCLPVIPLTGTRSHVYLGAVQVLLGETAFITAVGSSCSTNLPAFLYGFEVVSKSPVRPFRRERTLPFDEIVISLVEGLIAAVHVEENYPSIHLILSFLVESCLHSLYTNGFTGNSERGDKRLQEFICRLLYAAAPYLRALPLAQRPEGFYACIGASLYNLQYPKMVAFSAAVLVQLLAGRPDKRGVSRVEKSEAGSSSPSVHPAARSAVVGSHSTPPSHAAEKCRVKEKTEPLVGPTSLVTSMGDRMRAEQWILFMCHQSQWLASCKVLISLGNVVVGYLIGAGSSGLPLVLQCLRYAYMSHGGRTLERAGPSPQRKLAAKDTHLEEAKTPVSGGDEPPPYAMSVNEGIYLDNDIWTRAAVSWRKQQKKLSNAASTSRIPYEEADLGWQQWTLVMLACVGVIYDVPSLVRYIHQVWASRAARGEMAKGFSSTLFVGAPLVGAEQESSTASHRTHITNLEGLYQPHLWCGLKLSEEAAGPTTPKSATSTQHAAFPTTPVAKHRDPARVRESIPLSFRNVCRLLAEAQPEMLSCSPVISMNGEEKKGALNAAVSTVYGPLASDSYEKLVQQSMEKVRVGSQHLTATSESLSAASMNFSKLLAIDPELFGTEEPGASTLVSVSIHEPKGKSTSEKPSGSPEAHRQTRPLTEPSNSMRFNSVVDMGHGISPSGRDTEISTYESAVAASKHPVTVDTDDSGKLRGTLSGGNFSPVTVFSMGDAGHGRKPLTSFDKKEFLASPPQSSPGSTSKLDSMYAYYGTTPLSLLSSIPATRKLCVTPLAGGTSGSAFTPSVSGDYSEKADLDKSFSHRLKEWMDLQEKDQEAKDHTKTTPVGSTQDEGGKEKETVPQDRRSEDETQWVSQLPVWQYVYM